eukprot:11229727-Karenia_brevis.AAC.1
MVGASKKKDETTEEFLYRRNSAVKALLLKHNAHISKALIRKQWRYLGHVLRSSFNKNRKLLTFRTGTWWQEEKSHLHRKRHRKSGNQLTHIIT